MTTCDKGRSTFGQNEWRQLRTAPYLMQGRPSPQGNDAFPSCFRFPQFPKNFSDSVENFPDLTFTEKRFRFSSAKISDDFFPFLATGYKFYMSLLFSFFQFISPYFGQIFHSTRFAKLPLWFRTNFRVLYMLSMIFVSPYFHHDAFMHHTMQYWTPLEVWYSYISLN